MNSLLTDLSELDEPDSLVEVDQVIDDLDSELQSAGEMLSLQDRAALRGLAAGRCAVRALRAVHGALNELEPGAALTVLCALEAGLLELPA